MASSVYYKFKAQRDESKISFDGTGISVFDLKNEIILANGLKDNKDVDLLLLDPNTNQEYKDDSHVIPRSSSVVAKRVPAARPGKGKIPMYVAGAGATSVAGSSVGDAGGRGRMPLGAMSKRFDGRDEPAKPRPSTPTTVTLTGTNEDEAASIAAMFKATADNWEETQEMMSHAVPVFSANRGAPGGRGRKPFASRPTPHYQQDRPLPSSYVCYRCGKKGHWIQDCPTNNDREYDNRPRIKRTTGIPRSFLKAIDQPSEGGLTHGVMVTPEGGFVVAQPDAASWQKQVSRSTGITAADVRDRAPSDPALACPIDKKLFRDAVKTPCCGTPYCEQCANSYLLEHDFSCPKCGKKIPSLDKLIMDKPMRTRVGDYIDRIIKESNDLDDAEEGGEGSKEDGQDLLDTREDNEIYEEQPGNDASTFDVAQLLNETIPQLQAQISQCNAMLANPTLPPQARQSTDYHLRDLQMQLQQAQAFAALHADMTAVMQAAASGMGGGEFQETPQQMNPMVANNPNIGQGQWVSPASMGGQGGHGGHVGMGNMGMGTMSSGGSKNPFVHQQPAGQESAYQRLPVNRRRANKRERPSDFLEIGEAGGSGGDQGVKMPRFWE